LDRRKSCVSSLAYLVLRIFCGNFRVEVKDGISRQEFSLWLARVE
jgi:hypothetical protein